MEAKDLREEKRISSTLCLFCCVEKRENNTTTTKQPEYITLYINGGKKNKLNKVDIVGFLSQKGTLEKDELGLIEVKDFSSFVAVKQHKIKALLENIKDEKMKGKKYKIEVASNKIVVKKTSQQRNL